jgi:hypothetical protein
MDFGASALTKTPAFASAATCTMTKTAEWYDTGSGLWVAVPTQAWATHTAAGAVGQDPNIVF